MPNPLVHIPAVARRFYQTHGDSFDRLVVFANFTNALGNAFAFEQPIRISMTGTDNRSSILARSSAAPEGSTAC